MFLVLRPFHIQTNRTNEQTNRYLLKGAISNLISEHLRELVETFRHRWVVRTVGLVADRDSPLVQETCLLIISLNIQPGRGRI